MSNQSIFQNIMSDKSNLVSLLSILLILAALVDTTLAAGRREDENSSEGHKYFVCTPKDGILAYSSGQSIFGNCGDNDHYECSSRGNCQTEVGPARITGCGNPITLDFDKFTLDGGSLKLEKFRTSNRSGVLVRYRYEIDRATGSYESTEQLMATDGWTTTNQGQCKLVYKKLKF